MKKHGQCYFLTYLRPPKMLATFFQIYGPFLGISMYNSNTDSLGLILDVEVFFLLDTVQEHCELYFPNRTLYFSSQCLWFSSVFQISHPICKSCFIYNAIIIYEFGLCIYLAFQAKRFHINQRNQVAWKDHISLAYLLNWKHTAADRMWSMEILVIFCTVT